MNYAVGGDTGHRWIMRGTLSNIVAGDGSARSQCRRTCYCPGFTEEAEGDADPDDGDEHGGLHAGRAGDVAWVPISS